MSTAPAAPPTSIAPVTAAAGAAAPQAVAVLDGARAILGQARQVLLEATVQGRSPDGLVTLKTAQGNLQIRTAAPLPAGASLALELARNGDQFTARVVPAPARLASPQTASGAGQTTVAHAGDAPARMSTPAAVARGSDAPAPTRATEFGRTSFAGIVLAQPPQAPVATLPPRAPEAGSTAMPGTPRSAGDTPPQPPRPTAPAGDPRPAPSAAATMSTPTSSPDATLAIRAAGLYAQARATAPARDARTPPGAPQPPATTAPTSSSPVQGAPAPTMRLQPGATIELRLAQPPHTGGGVGRQAQPLPATVLGALPQARLMVDTPIGRLAVAVPPDLLATPAGAMLDLEWYPETTRTPPATGKQTADAQSTRAWPQTREAAAGLLAHADPAMRAAADRLVPRPGAQLAQQMMAFIGTGDGDLARWLGDAVLRQLEHAGLAEGLARGEGGATREPDRQPANGDWRHVTMPLFDGRTLHPIEFRGRRRNDGGGRDGPRDQSRFVVDCVHDELGAVQIDGLLTKGGQGQRLDVILRSHAELPETDRAAITLLFADACGAMGFGGEIAFQVADQFPVGTGPHLANRAVIA